MDLEQALELLQGVILQVRCTIPEGQQIVEAFNVVAYAARAGDGFADATDASGNDPLAARRANGADAKTPAKG